ncbi:MAG: hypothetical protein A3E83_02770 [Gammaproteobacteria bacterium RIFCSPHIGHO2_12_FULL_41_20]|nr:MAG: hypothetical protein A3E83_02770 [Gammaproteobacteria bacterium RIFCSPHIGHO2_12_FULL_41_20]
MADPRSDNIERAVYLISKTRPWTGEALTNDDLFILCPVDSEKEVTVREQADRAILWIRSEQERIRAYCIAKEQELRAVKLWDTYSAEIDSLHRLIKKLDDKRNEIIDIIENPDKNIHNKKVSLFALLADIQELYRSKHYVERQQELAGLIKTAPAKALQTLQEKRIQEWSHLVKQFDHQVAISIARLHERTKITDDPLWVAWQQESQQRLAAYTHTIQQLSITDLSAEKWEEKKREWVTAMKQTFVAWKASDTQQRQDFTAHLAQDIQRLAEDIQSCKTQLYQPSPSARPMDTAITIQVVIEKQVKELQDRYARMQAHVEGEKIPLTPTQKKQFTQLGTHLAHHADILASLIMEQKLLHQARESKGRNALQSSTDDQAILKEYLHSRAGKIAVALLQLEDIIEKTQGPLNKDTERKIKTYLSQQEKWQKALAENKQKLTSLTGDKKEKMQDSIRRLEGLLTILERIKELTTLTPTVAPQQPPATPTHARRGRSPG